MHKKNPGVNRRTLVIAWALGCAGAQAEEPRQVQDQPGEMIELSRFLMASEALGEVRAREGTSTFEQMNESDQRAWLEQNRLQSHMTGNNIMHESAMRIEGIGSVIQNSGNQVIIQDTTQINLSITP